MPTQHYMLSRSQVAHAVAMMTERVRVESRPFTVSPPNLFELSFNDVGINDYRMREFKERLKLALPLAKVIDEMPDDASLLIGRVAEVMQEGLIDVLGSRDFENWTWPLGLGEGESLGGFESAGQDVPSSAIPSAAEPGPVDSPPDAGPEWQPPPDGFESVGEEAPSSAMPSAPAPSSDEPGIGGSSDGEPSPPGGDPPPERSSPSRSPGAGGLPESMLYPPGRRHQAARSTRAKPPSREGGPRARSRTEKKRVVSTGFAEQTTAGKPLGSSLPLACNRDYYFWLEVGPPVKGAIDVSPQALPEKFIPRDALLKVALYDFDHKLKITPGADVGEIKLETDGTASVVRQPFEPQGVSSSSRLLKKRLFFPVKAGNLSDHAQLRCNIYYQQVLVQSRLVRVRIMRRPESMKRALSTSVDYTLSRTLNPARVADIEPHRLSVMLNDNGNGTHGFRFFGGKEFKNDASFDGQELQDYINLARGALRLAAWGDEDPWKQGKAYLYETSHNPQAAPDLMRMKADLVRLAIRGYRFYDSIIGKLTDSVDQADELAELMKTPGMIQIALKQSARYVFPAAMIYDYPLDTNAPAHTLCPGFLQSLNNADLLEKTDCFKGNCPNKDADTIVCPSGFWGYRHSLGMPLSLKNAPDAPSELKWEIQPQMTIGVSTDQAFVWRPAHEKALQSLQPQMGWNYGSTRADVLKLLKASTSQLVYFYCHGGMAGTVPFIQVGPATERGITRDNLRREKIRWNSPRPLVFINGCHTAALEPDVAMEFISAFVEVAGACGVIGTEITIFEPLARAFAEEFLGRFLKGEKIGDAIRGSRLKLLKDANPLGLVYIPYVIASLRMSEKAGN